jgi:hypothetical protein
MSAASATADVFSLVPAGGTIVPATIAFGVAGSAVRVRAIPLVGPPVMTGSPTAFCHVVVPSTMLAYRP